MDLAGASAPYSAAKKKNRLKARGMQRQHSQGRRQPPDSRKTRPQPRSVRFRKVSAQMQTARSG
ncbi:MAG TPA: hypothetical protein DDW78_01915 [Treponema sp.]|nr:hypothetical protein [Treponema sp.]